MAFTKIGVIGAGTMGQGIAEMMSARGLEVYLYEKTPEQLDYGWEQIEASLDKQLEKWAITTAEKKLILSRIHKVSDWSRVAECEMVIESITEDIEEKKQVFARLDEVCPPHMILASNTSTLSLTEMAAATQLPERVIGLHFVHPASKIQLVEIIRAVNTSDETLEQVKRFVEETIQLRGIQVYESPGFVTTRLVCILINEALHALSEGVAKAEDIDNAMKIGFQFHFGPLEMADRFGLDSVLASMERMFREFGDLKYRPSYVLKQMVRAGHLGVKSGRGFFRYDKEGDRL